MNLSTCTEKELLVHVSSGDERAFRLLFDLYQPKIYSFARYVTRSTFLAEEIVQEVFMKIWISRHELSGVEYFIAYLKTIARNVAANYLKRLAHERLILQHFSVGAPASRPVTDEDVIANELQRAIEDAIAALPPRQREIYLLHRQEYLKQEEIAKRLDISIHTVKEHIKKAIAAIRASVEQRIDVIIVIALREFFQ
ncbi:MAG: RNA polymerase sigma-70 factor [Odoribacteraceae bacterium]|jgi:RNA polymerase sigma-70 factor (ECF subfamily)|nr:RNA polymerase sigma-70 factor [Odoribacteraceae bacterium]